MELRRRTVSGRLTETFGPWILRLGDWAAPSGDAQSEREGLIRLDLAMRSLDLLGRAEASQAALRPETRAALDAYAAGVNAWLARVNEDALGGGAPEILALGLDIEPWRAVDSLASLKLVAAEMSASFIDDLGRGALAIALGPERLRDLLADESNTPGAARAGRGGAVQDSFDRWAALVGSPFSPSAARIRGASNGWAVSAARAASRAPLLANDPHLPLTAPSIWYVARLSLASGDVIGATIPGVPAVLIGRNERVAWGLTALYADVADVFLEELDPDDASRYRDGNGWATVSSREELIPLGDGQAVSATILSTSRGPALPLDWAPVARVTPPGHLLTLQWTALDERDTSIEAALGLMKAETVAEALAASERHVAPPLTMFFADEAHIAMTAAGRLPLRDAQSESRGALPSRGWRAENAWTGTLPRVARPRIVDPEDGRLANANTRLGARAYPEDLAQYWPAAYRQRRIEALLASREFHTASGFQAMQNDIVSEAARQLAPLMLTPLRAGLETETGLRRDAIERLSAWAGEMDAVAPEPLIYAAWTRALTSALLADDLGARGAVASGARPRFLERVLRDEGGAAARWCDRPSTQAVEGCGMAVSEALDAALAELSERYGARMAHWRWGAAHAARHAHEPFGRIPGLGFLFDIRHEMAGGDHTLWRAQSSGVGESPDETVNAGGFRVVFDFADLDRSAYALATGQSGHFLSDHYDDGLADWLGGEYRPLSLSRRDIEAGSVGVTRLTPPGWTPPAAAEEETAPAADAGEASR